MRFICSLSCLSSFVRQVRMFTALPTSLVMILSSATRPLSTRVRAPSLIHGSAGAQFGLVVFRLLALCGSQVVLLAVIGDVPSGVITRLPFLLTCTVCGLNTTSSAGG